MLQSSCSRCTAVARASMMTLHLSSTFTGIMKRVADERLNLSNALHGVGKVAAGASGRDVQKLLLGGHLFGRATASAADAVVSTPAADGVLLTRRPAT